MIDADGRQVSFFKTVGQVSDNIGAAELPDDLPKAQRMLANRCYDADWYRVALQSKGITPRIPEKKGGIIRDKYGRRRSRSRSSIEIMFGRLKDWRRVATRHDRCPTVFSSPSRSLQPSSTGSNQRVMSLNYQTPAKAHQF
jgi:transposase